VRRSLFLRGLLFVRRHTTRRGLFLQALLYIRRNGKSAILITPWFYTSVAMANLHILINPLFIIRRLLHCHGWRQQALFVTPSLLFRCDPGSERTSVAIHPSFSSRAPMPLCPWHAYRPPSRSRTLFIRCLQKPMLSACRAV